MRLEYVPLLQIQREIQGMPFGVERFRHYLRTIWSCYEADFELIPLLAANPMAKGHVTALLDELLESGAEGAAAQSTAAAAAELPEVPGEWKAALVVIDDLKGGWTNRFDWEFVLRFGAHHLRGGENTAAPVTMQQPKWSKFLWIIGALWSSEPASGDVVREAILAALYRVAFMHQHGVARTLRDMLVQEGEVMAMAGCTGPTLDDEDIAYTREVLAPHLDATDKRTCMECLFGDAAGLTLGFTPRGLSPWAGLALALHDAQVDAPAINR